MSLSKEEKAWIKKVQRVLDSCPNKEKFGFYTIGDPNISIYDKSLGVDERSDEMLDKNEDFCTTVHLLDAYIGSFDFPNCVHSTAG